MKLAFVIKTLDTRGGGAERILTQIISGLIARGHQVTLVSFGPPNEADFYPVDPKAHRIWLGMGDVHARSSGVDVWRRIAALRRAMRSLAPDVAVGFMHSAYVPLALALSTSSIPVVGSEHILFNHYRAFPREALALRLTAPLYSRMTIISEANRISFPPALANRMEVIPNPVVPTGRSADPVGGRSKLILNVGRLAPQKDQTTLIEAFARVAGEYPAWNVKIFGEGELRPKLEELVGRMGLKGRIELPGSVEDIGRQYERAQIFAMPSRYESFGLATAEALAQGLPVIGFADCPGTNELVEDHVNGILVRGSDRVATLAEGLRQLMGNSDLRRELGQAGPGSVAEYSLESIVDQWEALLRRCRGHRP